MKRALLTLSMLAALTACNERSAPPAGNPVAPPAAMSVKPPPTDSWIGEWTGPEGTALRIAGAGGNYDLTIHDLDGPRSFKGRVDGMAIRFERDGVAEAIHAGNGDATGMKWLAGKVDCLVVRDGEGYCRD